MDRLFSRGRGEENLGEKKERGTERRGGSAPLLSHPSSLPLYLRLIHPQPVLARPFQPRSDSRSLEPSLVKRQVSFSNWTVHAPEEALISLCQSSRVTTFSTNTKTQWQMFLLLHDLHVGLDRQQHGVSSQSSINFGEALLRITREWNRLKPFFSCHFTVLQTSSFDVFRLICR